MAEAIHGEARGEPVKGQIFVGQVILTRLKRGYGTDICKVVYARRQFAPKKKPTKASYRSAKKAIKKGPNGVTHFHSYKRRKTSKAIFSNSKKCTYAYKVGNHWGFTCGRRGLASH